MKNVIVHCDGAINYDPTTGSLSWAESLRVIFTRSDGVLIENTVVAGSIGVADGQMAYLDLSETNGAVLTVAVSALNTGANSTSISFNRLVLGYRNAASDAFYPVAIRQPVKLIGDMQKSDYDTDGDGKVNAAQNADAVAWSGVSDIPPNLVSLGGLALTDNSGKVPAVNETGTAFELVAPENGSGSSTLAGLSDVAIITPSEGQVLKYNAVTQKWEPDTDLSEGGTSATFAAVATIALMMGGY